MKFIITFLVVAVTTLPAYTCQVTNGSQGINSSFNYGGTSYKTVLPFSELSGSKNFDIENGEFPVGFGQIIKIAKGLTKKVEPEAAWTVESVGLNKYNYSGCVYWYYQFNIRSTNPSNSYLYLNIGLNGEKPEIYRIDEVLIN